MGNDKSRRSSGSHIPASLKVVVVGDHMNRLKTRWLIACTTGSFPGEYIPTVFDNYSANILYKGNPVNIGLWDTTGQEDFDRLRPLSYPQTDVVLLLYNKLDSASVDSIKNKWIQELFHYLPYVPIVIVECEGDDNGRHVSKQQFEELKKVVVPYSADITSFSHNKTFAKVLDTAIEAVIFSASLDLSKELARISAAVNDKIGQRAVKIIVVGDNMDGLKTRWLMTYTNNGKEIDYLPAAFDNYNANIQYKGIGVTIDLWDTKEYDRLRPLTYPQTDVVIMLYNQLDKKSLTNLKDIWLPELFRFIPTVPIILVETEYPLEQPGTPVSNEDAELMRTDRVIVPFSLEKTSFSDWTTVKKVIEEKALEAVEFSLNLPDLSFGTFSKEVKAKYKVELKRLKSEAHIAERDNDESSASAKEKLDELRTKIDREILERSMSSKFDLYAEQLGWK